MSAQLWVANRPFAIDWPRVVTFRDEGGWNASERRCVPVKTPDAALRWRPRRACDAAPADRFYDDFGVPACAGELPTGAGSTRTRDRYSHRAGCSGLTGDALLAAVRTRVRQMIVHLDGCSSSAMCFNVLHNERGLSCHLLIDNDGTIYQTLDLAFAAWHARGHNDISVGIELCSRGDNDAVPGACDRWGRTPQTCTIHGRTLLAWGYTQDQLDAMAALGRWTRQHLPAIPLDFPRGADGGQHPSVLDAPYSFSGWLGHYHTTARKWDPGPFDFEAFVRTVGGAVYYPVVPDENGARAVAVAEDATARQPVLDTLYARNEDAHCGLFPIGPYCEHQLWHGGAHLPARPGAPVFAVLPGQLIAARLGHAVGAGSTSFALLRHHVLGARREVYSLYYHLDHRARAIPKRWAAALTKRPGQVVLLDLPVDGGEQLGEVGQAGPDAEPQVHIEIFSLTRLGDDAFDLVESARNSRFCDHPPLLDALGQPHPPFDEAALRAAYADHHELRRLVVRSCSEWSPTCGGDDWTSALAARSSQLAHGDVRALVAQQLEPNLWWTEEIGAALGLPRDAYVYHYHPITFLGWIADHLAARAVAATAERSRFDEVTPTHPFQSDIGADAAETAHDPREDDGSYVRCRDQLDLDQVVEGRERAPDCWPWSSE